MTLKNCLTCEREINSNLDEEFCCNGCKAVYQVLDEMELEGEDKKQKKEALLSAVLSPLPTKDKLINDFSTEIDSDSSLDLSADVVEENLIVSGMVCPACTWIIHHTLSQLPGVHNVNVNFISESVRISFDPMQTGLDKIKTQISSLGYYLRESKQDIPNYNYYGFGIGWFLTMNVMMLSFVVYSAESWQVPKSMQLVCSILLLLFAFLVPIIAAKDTIKKGVQQMRFLRFRMESLIVLSTSTAFIYSLYSIYRKDFPHLYFEVVCLLLMLIETGNLISFAFYQKLRIRMNRLLDCLPKKVRIVHEGKPVTFKPASELQAFDLFKVLQGEVLPINGIVVGESEFDYSVITGESSSIRLKEGHFVPSGAKLISSEATLLVPAEGVKSFLEELVENTFSAFNTFGDTYSTGDKISRLFVPIILLIATSTFVYYFSFHGFEAALVSFLRVMIVSCPCVFGIAEPLVFTLAVDKMRRQGIQVINGNTLKQEPDTIIFDKTGTLTKSQLVVEKIHWLTEEKSLYLDILSSLENGVEHPLARTLMTLGKKVTISNRLIHSDSITGDFKQVTYRCGSIDYYKASSAVEPFLNSPNTLVAFGDKEHCLLIIELSDPLREESAETVASLQKLKKKVVISSGDRAAIVEKIARKLDVSEFHSSMTPESKQKLISTMQQSGRGVMMVGDGINDAGSLAAADFGLSVFSGQLPTKMTADAILLSNDLKTIPLIFNFIHHIKRKVFTNYFWAFLYNIVGITLAVMGKLSPSFCAYGMAFSNTVVLLNSTYWKKVK